MKPHQYFSVIFLLVGLLLSGCVNPADQPLSDPIALNTLHADYSWIGWSQKGYTVDVVCTDGTCNATAMCSVATGATEPDVTIDPVALDANALTNIGASLGSLRRVSEPQEIIEHTDDYPTYAITLIADNGQELVITSTSNTKDSTPWNIRVEDRLYIQQGSAFPDAYFALLDKVDPTSCW